MGDGQMDTDMAEGGMSPAVPKTPSSASVGNTPSPLIHQTSAGSVRVGAALSDTPVGCESLICVRVCPGVADPDSRCSFFFFLLRIFLFC